MKKGLALLVFSISIAYVESAVPALARTGESVTVRGVLARTGKAGNLWVLTLDQPYAAHDRSPGMPEKTILLKAIAFVGGRQGPQDPTLENKHVELTGNLIPPLGPWERCGVIVKTITVLSDDEVTFARLQAQIEELRKKSYAGPPAYLLPFKEGEPLSLSLDRVETLDGVVVGACIDDPTLPNSEVKTNRCNSKPERGVPVSEAARVLSQWVVVPKDYWENNFSHTDAYRRVLKLHQIDGKDFALELDPYGVGMVVFADGGGAYLVSPCNAAGLKTKNTSETKLPSACNGQ